ncbi:F0F1 ATP synthase subunit A [Microlunatus elymi]|uniref:ATP synthase subunit a n=1 Tax=Microlunatus elymi TaxID=2596828 RepID=A0A516Q0U4_9ACTN|nr:F0F1 ATP synthase subunit A [Microlunatus elymi]QDP97054.1 F0F1 ATP synthase subunit A [Microlunatus elymi]
MATPLLVPLEGFELPGVHSFDKPPIWHGAPSWFNLPMLMAIISMILIIAFWLIMSNKRSLVPTKGQFVGEFTYNFVRDGIARDQIGHDFKKFVPFLVALFSFILVNNIWGVFPVFVFPTIGKVGWAYGLAIMSWVLYNAVGIKKHGFFGYMRRSVLPSGVPWPMWFIIIPIEFVSNIILRPITLSLRLFANMFAGHLLILIFVLGGEYLLFESESLFNNVAGVVSLIFSMAIFGLEIFVEAFQAYIFTLLTAQYVGTALADEH